MTHPFQRMATRPSMSTGISSRSLLTPLARSLRVLADHAEQILLFSARRYSVVRAQLLQRINLYGPVSSLPSSLACRGEGLS